MEKWYQLIPFNQRLNSTGAFEGYSGEQRREWFIKQQQDDRRIREEAAQRGREQASRGELTQDEIGVKETISWRDQHLKACCNEASL